MPPVMMALLQTLIWDISFYHSSTKNMEFPSGQQSKYRFH